MAEKRTIELEVKESGFKSLKAQIKEANIELIKAQENFGDYSNEAIKAAKNVAGLKDKIAEAAETAALFDPGKKFQVATGAITAAAGAMSAYEGAMGLLGVESEQLEKAMLRVQSAMALSQGLSAVADARKDFARLGAVVGDVFSKMTTASKAFMVGGIGLLITGVALLVANWDSVTEALGATTKEQKKLREETSRFNKAAQESAEYVAKESAEFVTLIHQLKQTNENSKERKGLITQINKQYGTTLKNISDETAFQAALNLALEDYIKFQKDSFRLAKNKELIQKAIEKEDVVTTKLNKEKRKLAEIEERLNEELNKRVSIDAYLKNGSEGAAKAENLQKLRVANVTAEFEKQQTAVRILSVEYNNIEERIRNYSKTASSLESDIEGKYIPATEKQTKATKDATAEINKNAIEGRLELKTIKEVDNLDSLDMLKEQVDAEALINKEARDAETAATELALKERRQRNVDFTLQSATQMLDIIGDLAQQSEEKFKGLNAAVLNNQQTTDEQKQKLLDENNKRAKKAFEIQKAASIASTLINTYMSARSAYFSQFLPIPDPSSPIRGGIAAGLSVAGGLVAVKNIASQKFEGASMSGGGGGGGGSMGGGGAPTAPNFNIVGNSGINQLAELGGQPIQAYVVSGEVTSAQALDRNRIQNATF